jgi:glutathione S-transferase
MQTIIGRSSSSFTRVTRIFAVELGVDCAFHVVRDMMSLDPADYGDNPALKLPILLTPAGSWFGALNICRELSRQSTVKRQIVWSEDFAEPLLANTQELVAHAMATEVALIMAKLAGPSSNEGKTRQSLVNTMAWLETNASQALAALPAERDVSYLEVTLFCLVTHLEFRDVLPMSSYPALSELSGRFGARASAAATPYRFDA